MMFDFFKRRDYKMPEVPTISAPEPTECYSIGTTTEGTHLTFKLGYTTLTMNKVGCQHLIDQLELFKTQLKAEND